MRRASRSGRPKTKRTLNHRAFLFSIQPIPPIPSSEGTTSPIPSTGAQRPFRLLLRHKEQICSWVTTRRSLTLVSGESADRLSVPILNRWIDSSLAAFVALKTSDRTALGFCTLSRAELPGIPPSYVEICHLVVDPGHRRLAVGSSLVRSAIQYASLRCFSFVCGRVVSSNDYALTLAHYMRAEEITGLERWLPEDFRWFRFVSKHNED